MSDILYFNKGDISVTDMGMEIEEFKNFKRYDTSTNKSFFGYAVRYIFYVYQIFAEGNQKSYMANMPLPQRKISAVKKHTGPYKKVSEFEDNKWVKECIDAYKRYSYSQNMIMFDTLKEDIFQFIDLINNTPHTIKETIVVYKRILDDGPEEPIRVPVDVPFASRRLELVKQAAELNDLFQKKQKDATKDMLSRRNRSISMFEDKEYVKNIPLNEIPRSNE